MCDLKPVMWCAVHSLIFILVAVAGTGQQNVNNYGPYVIIWETYELCKGPKPGECGNLELATPVNISDVTILVDFPNDCPATMGKIVVTTQTNNITKKLWNYVLNKPCEHFVMGPVLIASFNLDKDCKVIKGHYDVHMDFAAKAKSFLGKSFFYGVYTFQIMAYNKVNNFFCIKTRVEIQKHP